MFTWMLPLMFAGMHMHVSNDWMRLSSCTHIFKPWSSVAGTIYGGLGSVVMRKYACYQRQAWRESLKTCTMYRSLICFMLVAEDVSSWLLALATIPVWFHILSLRKHLVPWK